MADSATRRRSQHTVMAGEVSGDAADDGAFDAAPGVGWNGRHSNRESERSAAQNCLHIGRPVYFLFANSWPARLFRFHAIRKGVRRVRLGSDRAAGRCAAESEPH
jgi:hypothetical protein